MSAYPRARSEGIVVEEFRKELLVYVEATRTAHLLSEDAASVWRHCDGERSSEEIARRVGLGEARVAHALEQLSKAELIEQPEGISRRALHKRAAKLAAAALSAPLIQSLAIPPASAAASFTCASLALSKTTGNGTFSQGQNDADGAKHYSLNFGQVQTASATFTVMNNGPGNSLPLTVVLTLGADAAHGHFALGSDGCNGNSLASGDSCTFAVSWNAAEPPPSSANCAGTLDATVTVSGTGVPCLRLGALAGCPPN